MPPRVIDGLEGLQALVGKSLGQSEWFEVTQERVNQFADGTGDNQWIHCDPERAARESPYGTTVAHGFFTLSLSPVLAQQIYSVTGLKLVLNYGLNRVRFPSPVKVGSRVRMSCELLELKVMGPGVQVVTRSVFEVKGEDKPVCVAESVVRMFF
ncbi:MAG TPA: MaoC family dehydratase [Pirellulales bacterium]|jgi:acyl dehydratase